MSTLWAVLQLLVLGFASWRSAECIPSPIAVRIGNVTLPNNSVSRRMKLALGTPAKPVAFMPHWPLNNTMIYGTSGFCDLGPEKFTQKGCITFRGVDSATFPQMSFVADSLKLNDNLSLTNFPMGIALNNWGEQRYTPQMVIGMGANSTFLSALKSSGKIAVHSFRIFWGRQGANSKTQLDGNIVFGGYDRAKVSGQPYTQSISPDRAICPTGMLVIIIDMILNLPNGTNTSIFTGSRSASISAYLVLDYPVLMTLPLNPYFSTFRNLTGAKLPGRSFGLNFFAVRYSDATDTPYNGNLTFKFQSGLAVQIPNDQLANFTEPTLVINPIQDINGNDLVQLGRQFLSSAYLTVNEDTGSFSLWAANPTGREELVGFGKAGEESTDFCPGAEQCTAPSRRRQGYQSESLATADYK
ncbi:aspartic peptidase domain-containing protein [Podospora fimiseda]|uniref:Aspartic peptidase domain-containing protein n=1 Tax=Podospora fimiseda TaxID=252190 RepID=A0AAN7H6G4_9PEZI|nr:aspartic peptidase domain-containing protein [Podospora fimiseda]